VQVSNYICAGRISAKIDKVAGIIETKRWAASAAPRWRRCRGGGGRVLLCCDGWRRQRLTPPCPALPPGPQA
jgi:hypothetical protein